MKPKHITELEVQEMEYYRILNDQITSIENLKQEDYKNKKSWNGTKKDMT